MNEKFKQLALKAKMAGAKDRIVGILRELGEFSYAGSENDMLEDLLDDITSSQRDEIDRRIAEADRAIEDAERRDMQRNAPIVL